MREITAAEANELRKSGAAGWFAIYANPPEPHPEQHVVEIGRRYFLTSVQEFAVEYAGVLHVPQLRAQFKAAYNIVVKNDELAQLLQAETKKTPEVDLGLGRPAHNGNVLQPPT